MNTIIQTLSSYNNRVEQWKINNLSYVAWFDRILIIPTQADKPFPNISLRHGGYTQPNDDGKRAILSVSVQSMNKLLSEQEINELVNDGNLINIVKIVPPDKWLLNAFLPLNSEEESRIRTSLNLPKQISGINSSIPFQILWTDVDGDKLYSWLTSKEGFKISMTGKAKLSIELIQPIIVDKEAIAQWWINVFETKNTVEWEYSIDVLAESMISNNCFKLGDEPVKLFFLLPFFKKISSALSVIAPVLNNINRQLVRDKFVNFNWNDNLQISLETEVSVEQLVRPGFELLNFPNLVIDLEEIGYGLEALLP